MAAGSETAQGPQIQELLEQRLKEVGHYGREVFFDPKAPLAENLPDGTIQIRLGHNGHQSSGKKPSEHVFVYDPTRIEVVARDIEPRNKSNVLRELRDQGYNPLYTPNNRLVAYKPIPLAQQPVKQ